MIESERKLKDFERRLNSKNKKIVSEVIISLRNEISFKGAIALLTSLLDRTNDLIIRDLIQKFLNDIKEPGSKIEMVAEIMKDYKPETTCVLVSSCWQSGQDYSDFAGSFANVFMKGDYLTALECFTVIEESVHNITALNKSEIVRFLENNKETSSIDKASLLEALITILS
jgi:hypothetical protein